MQEESGEKITKIYQRYTPKNVEAKFSNVINLLVRVEKMWTWKGNCFSGEESSAFSSVAKSYRSKYLKYLILWCNTYTTALIFWKGITRSHYNFYWKCVCDSKLYDYNLYLSGYPKYIQNFDEKRSYGNKTPSPLYHTSNFHHTNKCRLVIYSILLPPTPCVSTQPNTHIPSNY